MKWLEAAPFLAVAMMALVVGHAQAQSQTGSQSQPPGQATTGGTNLTPGAPAAVTLAPGATEMMSVPAPATASFGAAPSFTGSSSGSAAPSAGAQAGTSGTGGASAAGSGSAAGGTNPFNPDCAIAGSDDPANMSFDTIGCGQ